MNRLTLSLIIGLVPVLGVACRDAIGPTQPNAIAVAPGTAATDTQAQSSGHVHRITIQDACDQETFAAAGIACARNGGVRLVRFFDLLTKHQEVGAWHFAPSVIQATVGQSLLATNHGGEVHSFTEVDGSARIAQKSASRRKTPSGENGKLCRQPGRHTAPAQNRTHY
jgi:hypothetical protein